MNEQNSITLPPLDFGGLLSKAQKMRSPAFTGTWATIELQPDLFVPQKLTVGVVVQTEGHRLHFKLLDSFKKFECLYGERFPQRSVRELMAHAEQALRTAVQSKLPLSAVNFGTSALSFGTPAFTSGAEWEETVERLFGEVVVMAPHGKKDEDSFDFIDTPKARQLVNAHLKLIAGIAYERIVAEGDGILVDIDGTRHWLDLNLTPPGACGSVVSAVYKSVSSVEMNLLKASRDLTTYARMRRTEATGLFLLLPEQGSMDAKEFKRIENVIDEHEWKLERDGFRVVSMPSTELLAREVFEWARPHLA